MTSTATSARVGSMTIEPWPSGTTGRLSVSTSSQAPASASAPAARRSGVPGSAQSRSASAAAPGAGRASPGAPGAASASHSAPQRRGLGGDLRVRRVGGRRAQDQPQAGIRARHRRLGQRRQPGATLRIVQRSGHVDARRPRREDREAALQEHPHGDRRRLARLRPAAHLHEERPPRRRELRPAQEAREPASEIDDHPAEALHRPARHRAVDRLRPRRRIGRVGIDEEVLEPPVQHQRRRVPARGQGLDEDLPSLHGRTPAASRRPSVSTSGRPTTLE